jgi:hypothetical protein
MNTSLQNTDTESALRTATPIWRVALVLVVGALTGALLLVGEARLDDLSATAPMTAVGIATLAYLAAAVTGRRWMAWVWVAAGTLLVFAAQLADVPRWVVLAVAGVILVIIGIVRRRAMTTPQALAMLGYFGIAVIALFLAPRVGLALAGLALAAHAAWDVVHYRRNIVVGRSLALWCIGLDVVAGAICITFAVTG